MAPKVVDKEQRAKEIALVALEVFSERGVKDTSISQIAEAAGIGKGTIYEYFSSKEDLIFKALITWMEHFSVAAEELIAGVENPEDQLRCSIHGMMEHFLNDPQVIRLLMALFELMYTVKDIAQYHIIRDGFAGMRKGIIQILLDGVGRGIFRPEIAPHAEKIAINLLAYLDGIAMHYYVSDNYFDLLEQVDFFVENLLRSLRKKDPA